MEERESLVSQLTRGKQGFTTQIDELRRLLDEESKVVTTQALRGGRGAPAPRPPGPPLLV